MYIATSEPNGFVFCSARYADPSRGFGSSGVLIFTVPIFDASGHVGGSALCSAIPSSLHACNPSAPAGLIATPSGSATVVFFTSASESPSPFRLTACGTCTVTASPVGVLPACSSGVKLIDGSNGSRLQPSNAGSGTVSGEDTKLPSFAQESASTLVCSGPVHEVGSAISGGGSCCAPSDTHGPTYPPSPLPLA